MKSTMHVLLVGWLVASTITLPVVAGAQGSGSEFDWRSGSEVSGDRVELDLRRIAEPGGMIFLEPAFTDLLLHWSDDGLGPDLVAGDGVYSAEMTRTERELLAEALIETRKDGGMVEFLEGSRYHGFASDGQSPLRFIGGEEIEPNLAIVAALAIMGFGYTVGCGVRLYNCANWWWGMSAEEQAGYNGYPGYMHMCMNLVGCPYVG